MQKKIKIYLDIDDVVAAWHEAYYKRFNRKPIDYWDTTDTMSNHLSILKKEKSFWVNLPIKHFPNFQPSGYLSARSIPKAWTYEFMKLNKLPGRSYINQVPWGVSKIDKLKQLSCSIFIDDKLETFLECNRNGIFCLLMDACHNQGYTTHLRINKLDYNEIMEMYHKYGNKN